jgi:hypothetical protein
MVSSFLLLSVTTPSHQLKNKIEKAEEYLTYQNRKYKE